MNKGDFKTVLDLAALVLMITERTSLGESLYKLEELNDFIKLILWTGQLKEERPCSVIVIAPPGSGKTTLLENLKCDFAEFVGDLTARSLHGLLKNKNATHILLGDMLSLFGHKSSTVDLTLRLLSQMTGEDIRHDPWTGEPIEPRKIGFITAIPPDDFNNPRNKAKIASGGLFTRFMIVRFNYKPSTISSIHHFIARDGYVNNSSKPFMIPNPGRWSIKIPNEISDEIEQYALVIKKDPLGFRAARNLRALVRAAARRTGNTTVGQKDFDLVKSYCDFFTKEGKDI